MKRVIKFRIYPESVHGFYFDVEIHPTVKAMRRTAQREGADSSNFLDADGATLGFRHYAWDDKRKTHVLRKTLGLMVFHRDRLDAEVLAHESGHAAIRWMEAMRLDLEMRKDPMADRPMQDEMANEERFCYALGRMAAQISDQCWKHGLQG
ncbi:MAG: hypothetical protein ABIR33_09495 [Pyrinomonadaceae bacterium]